MNHHPIYGTRPPAFCSAKGDTADTEQPVDCPRCQRKLSELAELHNLLAERARTALSRMEHHARAMHYESMCSQGTTA